MIVKVGTMITFWEIATVAAAEYEGSIYLNNDFISK